MKKFLSLMLAVLMVLSLVACASETPADTTTDTPAETPAEEPSETPDASEEPSQTPVEETPVEELPSQVEGGVTVTMPLVTEPTTLRFWWPSVAGLLTFDMSNASDYLYFAEMEKRSGVTVEIEVPNDAQTQFGLLMASQDYPDFIEYFGNYYTQGYDHAIEEELIVPLEEYAEYLPNIMNIVNSNDDIRRQVMTDEGHLPGIPTLNMRRYGSYYNSNNWAGYVIREDMLNELNMEVPTTYDELTTLLGAMKDNYSDTAIPFQLSCMNGNFMLALGGMFWSGYGFTADWMQKDGVVEYSLTSDSYKQYLQMLNNWYSNGYLDPDLMSSMTLWTDATNAVTDQFGVFPLIYTQMGQIIETAQSEIPSYSLVAMEPLKVTEDAEEHVCFATGLGSVSSVVMATSPNIELVCQWWDYFFSEEGIILGNYGIEGEHFNYDENGIPKWIPEAFTSDDPQWNLSNLQYKYVLYNTPGYIEQDREWIMVDETALNVLNLWNENSGSDWNYPAAATMTASESEDYASIMNDISTYVNECAAKFLIGEMDFEGDWEDYVSAVESMGLEDALDCKQAALDRYNAR